MKLGIFDSGIGGEAVAVALRTTFPTATILTVNDHKNLPYGDKSGDEIIALTDAAIQPLLSEHCDVVILACNSATAAAITTLRARYPDQKFIGIEPMIKPAADQPQTKTIAVFATPATLASKRYNDLVQKCGAHLTILEPDCSTWAAMIENNSINRSEIKAIVQDVTAKGADVIVLGCTHYHWIKEEIIKIADGRAKVIDPSDAISQRVRSIIYPA